MKRTGMATSTHGNLHWIFTVLGCLGFITLLFLRSNINIGIIAMTKGDKSSDVGLNYTRNISSYRRMETFSWSEAKQGYVLSGYFCGYMLSQIPGGELSRRIGGKWVIFSSILFSSLFTLLMPVIARTNFYAFLICLFLNGLSHGPCFPAMYTMLGKWAPEEDRSKMNALLWSGCFIGASISMPMSAALASSNILGGWPAVFYVPGFIGIIFCIMWAFCAFESPEKHPSVIKKYQTIVDSQDVIEANDRKYSMTAPKVEHVSWFTIVCCKASIAIIVVYIGMGFSIALIMTGIPQFYKNVLGISLLSNGLYNSLPSIAMAVSANISAIAVDCLIARWNVSRTIIRKLLCIFALIPTASLLLLASFTSTGQESLAVTFIVLAASCQALFMGGIGANVIEVTQNHSGILMAVGNSVMSIAMFAEPVVLGYLTDGQPTRGQYRKIMAITAGLLVGSCLFYSIFGSGERQSWDQVDNEVARILEGKEVGRKKDVSDEKTPLLRTNSF